MILLTVEEILSHDKNINTLSTGNQRKKRDQGKGYAFHNDIKKWRVTRGPLSKDSD